LLFYYKAEIFTASSLQLEWPLKCILAAEITSQQQLVKGEGEGVDMNEVNFRKNQRAITLAGEKVLEQHQTA